MESPKATLFGGMPGNQNGKYIGHKSAGQVLRMTDVLVKELSAVREGGHYPVDSG